MTDQPDTQKQQPDTQTEPQKQPDNDPALDVKQSTIEVREIRPNKTGDVRPNR